MIVLTGHAGGIGRALAHAFLEAGHSVLGIDRVSNAAVVTDELTLDLITLGTKEGKLILETQLRELLDGRPVEALINNAAWQCVCPIRSLDPEQLTQSFLINAIAPMTIFQLLCEALRASEGTLVNVTSVHTLASKADFGAYASSKAALGSLTRSIALEEGNWLRVIELRLGAVSTPMLEAGFEGEPEKRQLLNDFQPSGRVCKPEELANLIVSLLSDKGIGLHGAVLNLDGGIHYSLRDPA
ncbi:MAG: SDR family oxidoreductase [Pseudomonadota bacterium]